MTKRTVHGLPKADQNRWGDESRRAIALARRYLRFGTRSTAELRTYLQERSVPTRVIDGVIAEWSKNGLLDDRACAKLWATSLADRGYAWASIRQRLLAKGLEEALISQVIGLLAEGADDATRARALVQARERHDRNRVAQFLAQRGFDSELIDRVLAESFGTTSD